MLRLGHILPLNAALPIIIPQFCVLPLHISILDSLMIICIFVSCAGSDQLTLLISQINVICFVHLPRMLIGMLLLLLNEAEVVVDVLLHLLCQTEPSCHFLILQEIIAFRLQRSLGFDFAIVSKALLVWSLFRKLVSILILCIILVFWNGIYHLRHLLHRLVVKVPWASWAATSEDVEGLWMAVTSSWVISWGALALQLVVKSWFRSLLHWELVHDRVKIWLHLILSLGIIESILPSFIFIVAELEVIHCQRQLIIQP